MNYRLDVIHVRLDAAGAPAEPVRTETRDLNTVDRDAALAAARAYLATQRRHVLSLNATPDGLQALVSDAPPPVRREPGWLFRGKSPKPPVR